jgi:cob(I)alamin adenosyltransferase
MNTQDQMWTIQNQIHELKLRISTENKIDYLKTYSDLYILEEKLKELENECDRQSEKS